MKLSWQEQAQRDEVQHRAIKREWDAFAARLEAANSIRDAAELMNGAVRKDLPGGEFYSNLGFFLQSFKCPAGSSFGERELYLKFIDRLHKSGTLDEVAVTSIKDNFPAG